MTPSSFKVRASINLGSIFRKTQEQKDIPFYEDGTKRQVDEIPGGNEMMKGANSQIRILTTIGFQQEHSTFLVRRPPHKSGENGARMRSRCRRTTAACRRSMRAGCEFRASEAFLCRRAHPVFIEAAAAAMGTCMDYVRSKW